MALSGIIRSPVRAIASSGLAGDQGLLGRATSILGGIEPLHYWDFTANRAIFNSLDVGGVASTPGWSFARASVGTYDNSDGSITSFSSGELRRSSRGLLLEEARTNLVLNSATGATQTITVAAGSAHTLSFLGAGTITLSGASTAGPLVGTGATTRVALTFTPSTTSLTLTVTGSCTNVQLEVGNSASTWIPTTGASVQRVSDVLTVSSPGVTFPLTMFVEFERAFDTGNGVTLLRLDDGTDPERAILGINATDLSRTVVAAANVTQADVTVAGTTTVGVTQKLAGAIETNRVSTCRNGTLGTPDTLATMPATPTTLRFGVNTGTLTQPFSYLRRVAIFNRALTDAQLQAVTA